MLTNQGCDDLKAAGYVGIIVQAVTGLDGQTFTMQQLAMARRNGLRVQGYVYCWPGASADSMLSRLAMFDGFQIEKLWLDVEEQGLTKTDVDRDLFICDTYFEGLTGVYGSKWFWDQQGWTQYTAWADDGRSLWNADYNGIPEVGAGFVPFGGWTMPTISQFRGSTSIGSVSGIDLNISRGNA